MAHETVQLQTEDGICPTHVFQPAGKGPWPAVVFYMDGLGIRPALFEMGERLATAGYYVAMPDLYYRSGFTMAEPTTLFSNPETREYWMANVLPTVSVANIMRDLPAILAHIDAQPAARDGAIGTTGYCLGGKFALSAAGNFPGRVVAAASYHGAQLATDAPDSPHLLAPEMKARVYVGGATGDAGFDDAQKARLEQALTDAHVDHTVETYNARHGWVPSDTPVHDVAAAERHWETLLALFAGTLKGSGGSGTH